MEPHIKNRLRAKGEDLRANHDEAVIADVIGEVEQLEGEEHEKTGEILRVMAGAE